MKNSQKDYNIPTTATLCASCLGILLILAIKLSIVGGILALIYLTIKWFIQNT
ncbi:MAG: hypothetical protein IJV91_08890 [Kiritimatiellae bacterium]|nr:hypothetical protein [Kiritimatiellia bacterium]